MFVGQRVKTLRKAKNLTQQNLADMINVTKVSICCYEKGTRTPNLDTFIDFVNFVEKIEMNDTVNMTALKRLVKIYNETEDLAKFTEKVIYEYETKIDKLMEKRIDNIAKEMFSSVSDPNRPLFSKETAKKIMEHMEEKEIAEMKE